MICKHFSQRAGNFSDLSRNGMLKDGSAPAGAVLGMMAAGTM